MLHNEQVGQIKNHLRGDAMNHVAQWGVVISETPLDGETTYHFSHGIDEPLEAASINKLAITEALMSQEPDLDEVMVLRGSDERPGNGILQYFDRGFELPLGAAVELCLSISDNTAARIVARAAGGPAKINGILAEQGYEHTRLREMQPGKKGLAPEAIYEYGLTTARESARLFDRNLLHQPTSVALHSGNFLGGLRYHLESLRDLKAGQEPIMTPYVSHIMRGRTPIEAYQALLEQPLQPTDNPNKEGDYCEREDGGWTTNRKHDVGRIGVYTVAMLCVSNEGDAAGIRHHAREVQATVGDILSRA